MTKSKSSLKRLRTEQLREVAWELGQCYPSTSTGDYLAFTPIRTGLAYLNWSMLESSVRMLHDAEGESFNGASQALRIYDVSLIEFDGTNAHGFHDVHVEGLTGHYYMHSDQIERTLMAEVGFRLWDGRWLPLARSQAVFMDRNYRVGHADAAGLYVAGRFDRVFPVENVYHAAVYEGVHHAWNDSGGATVHVKAHASEADPDIEERLLAYLQEQYVALEKFGISVGQSRKADLIHAHGAGALRKALEESKRRRLPLVLSLHSTEHARAALQSREPDLAVWKQEVAGAEAADLVIVPHGEMRDHLLAECELASERVVLLPDLFDTGVSRAFDPGEIKQHYHLHPNHPLVLFSGEISHAAGADLLAGAIEHVAGSHRDVQFMFVGEGPLKGELEGRLHHAGLGGRVRFAGDLWPAAFHDVLAAADFVVIPARTWQDEALAREALEAGKPVIATHQSRIHCIHHGENGFMVYDNPGSIIWGLQEMLANPFQCGPGGIIRRPRHDDCSLESVAAELATLYRGVLALAKEVKHG